jgi:tetratricopeptide (TPR) repeat protein
MGMMAMIAEVSRPPASGSTDAILAATVLGAGLPAAAERHLRQAGLAYHCDEIAEQHLWKARALAPDHAAVLIGLYRFYFYKGRLANALQVARVCLDKAARDNDLASDWRRVRPGDANFGAFEAMIPRFYLFTLKAYAYLQMRLGEYTEGQAAVMKLLELDPTDKIGARVLLDVLERMRDDDDD